jgi:CheY-like chemotaxis protein
MGDRGAMMAPEVLMSGKNVKQELRDILQMQGEIAESIAGQIHQLIDPGLRSRATARQVHPQAYEAYLKGNYCRDKMTPADLQKSVEFFTLAMDLDPTYAQPYAGIAQVYFLMGVFGMAPSVDVFPKAKANAVKALETLQHNQFSVIITDQQMPILTGLECLAQAKQMQPNATRVLITAVLSLSTVIDAINKGEIYRFIVKPWLREELLVTVKKS